MRRQKHWLLVIPAVLTIGLLTACAGLVQKPLSPASGTATVEELVAVYREAHAHNDPERLRAIDLTSSLLADWIPMNGQMKSALQGLFKLDLEEVRVARIPPTEPVNCCPSYMWQGQGSQETPKMAVLAAAHLGKLLLVGTRPDGLRVEVDPGLGVSQLQGRFYLYMYEPIIEDAAQSIRTGAEPRYRAIPLGTDRELVWRMIKNKSWPEALHTLDELERDAKQQQSKAPPNEK